MDVKGRDVNEAQFHDAWRGYNQAEVDDFLDRVAETIDLLERDNEALRARLTDLETKVAGSRNAEHMLKQTLVSAQQTAEEAIGRAKTKAEQLMAEAEERVRRADERARGKMQQAENEVRRRHTDADRATDSRRRDLEASVEKLKALEGRIKSDLKTYLQQQIKALDALSIAGSIAGPSAPDEPARRGEAVRAPVQAAPVQAAPVQAAPEQPPVPQNSEPAGGGPSAENLLAFPESQSGASRPGRSSGRGRVRAWFTRSDKD